MIRYVGIKFDVSSDRNLKSTGVYTFLTDLDNLKVDDIVVVETSNGYGVGRVDSFLKCSTVASKWVMQKVDLDAHAKRIEKSVRLEQIKRELEDMEKQQAEYDRWLSLARTNKKAAELIAELDDIMS